MDLTLILTVLGIAATLIAPAAGYILKQRKDHKNYYSIIWKNSKSLKPKDLLGERPFEEFYLERNIDGFLSRAIERNRNTLVLGPPLSGKTRAVFNTIKNMRSKADILVPRSVLMPTFQFPFNYKIWKSKMIFIDDLQYYTERQDNYHLLFRKAKESGIPIVATCHSGKEFKKVKNRFIEHNLDIDTIFGDDIINVDKISPEDGKKVAESLGMKWDNVKFNGTIGSIFMRLSEMERRYDQCDNIEKTVLLSVRCLYKSGVYDGNNTFKVEWIKKTAMRYELEGKDFEWLGWIKSLEDKEFLKLVRRDKIWAEDAYLEYVIKPQVEIPDSEIISEVTGIFSEDPEVLTMIGKRAYSVGSVNIDISDYMKTAIESFTLALKAFKPEDKAGLTAVNEFLGLCHWRLSLIEDVKENCVKSLQYHETALSNIQPDEQPRDYARIQNERGNAYTSLADVADKKENCKLAINCFNEALKFLSESESPLQFAQIYHNIGGTYFILSQEEDTAKNLKLAIESLKKALRERNSENHPAEYALTNNNLGNCYANLSLLEEKNKNLERSIEHFNNILKVHDKAKYPLLYSTTITNLGNVYSMLAEVENFEENIRKSLNMLNEALEIRNPVKFPLQYAASQYSLGDVYLFIAQVKRNPEYAHKAVEAFSECLSVRTLDVYPIQYAMTQNILGKAYSFLAEYEDKTDNYHNALKAFDEALKVYTPENYPDYYEDVIENISKAKKIFF